MVGLVFMAVCSSRTVSAITAQDKYFTAEACYKRLSQNPSKQKFRHNWMRCIRKFQEVHRHDPSGPWAAAGLYQSARLYQGLYKHSGRKSDEREALAVYKRIVKQFPKSRYSKKAAMAIRSIPGAYPQSKKRPGNIKKPIRSSVDNATAAKIRKASPPASSAASRVTITGLRYWSNPNYTRIVIDADRPATYRHHLLKKDPTLKKPQRLYVDLDNSLLGKDAAKIIPINDDHLVDTRAGQYTPESVSYTHLTLPTN